MAEKYILNQIPGFEIGAVGHIRTMMAVEALWHTCERCGTTEGVTTNMEGYRLTLCPECRKEIKPRIITKRKIAIIR